MYVKKMLCINKSIHPFKKASDLIFQTTWAQGMPCFKCMILPTYLMMPFIHLIMHGPATKMGGLKTPPGSRRQVFWVSPTPWYICKSSVGSIGAMGSTLHELKN